MKKILLTLGLAAVAAVSSFGQGTIAIYSTSGTFSTYTNSSAYTTSLNGVYNNSQGKAATGANAFYYALLFQPYTNGYSSITPLSASYQLGGYATNYLVAGGVRGSGGSSGSAVANWAPSVDNSSYTTGEEKNYLLVGWSANLGTTWTTVSAELASGNWAANGFFGVSALGYCYAGGGGSPALGAVNIFGVSTGAPGGLSTGITLYSVSPVPEPSTFALAALGGASLLLFRRRK